MCINMLQRINYDVMTAIGFLRNKIRNHLFIIQYYNAIFTRDHFYGFAGNRILLDVKLKVKSFYWLMN